MNNYKSFSDLKEELGNNYDFKLYEMGISALKEIENLQQENKQLKEELEEYKNPNKYFKFANKNVTDENKQLKDNWNKLKDYIKTEIPEDVFIDTEWFVSILDKMQELEQGSDSNGQ